MRWYVSRNGETVGPVDDAQVAEWVRQGMSDALLRDEASPDWIPVAQSPFSQFVPTAKQKRNTPLLVLIGVLGVLYVIYFVVTAGDTASTGPPAVEVPKDPRPSSARAKPAGEIVCRVRIPKAPDMDVPALPTEEGFDEYGKAAAQGLSDREMMLVLTGNGGKLINPGTKCSFVDVGLASTRARVLEGSFAGQTFWFPSEWTRGREGAESD